MGGLKCKQGVNTEYQNTIMTGVSSLVKHHFFRGISDMCVDCIDFQCLDLFHVFVLFSLSCCAVVMTNNAINFSFIVVVIVFVLQKKN